MSHSQSSDGSYVSVQLWRSYPGSGGTMKMLEARGVPGGVTTYGWPGGIQLPICGTYQEFLESVALYGIGAINVTTLNSAGCQTDFQPVVSEVEEDIK
jgi:hypothetical protein